MLITLKDSQVEASAASGAFSCLSSKCPGEEGVHTSALAPATPHKQKGSAYTVKAY